MRIVGSEEWERLSAVLRVGRVFGAIDLRFCDLCSQIKVVLARLSTFWKGKWQNFSLNQC